MNRHEYNQKQSGMPSYYRPSKNRGDTLIEILITFFIISVGVLGASSMQIIALQNVNGSSYRDQAVIVVENLTELMRAVGPAGYNALTDGFNNPQNTANLPNPLNANLPSGDIQSIQTANGITITVRWDEDGNNSIGRNCPIISSADLDCYQVTLVR